MCKKLYQYSEVCAFVKSHDYVIWILVVVVSSVPRWEFARSLQKNLKKSYGVDIDPGAGKKKKAKKTKKTTTVGLAL